MLQSTANEYVPLEFSSIENPKPTQNTQRSQRKSKRRIYAGSKLAPNQANVAVNLQSVATVPATAAKVGSSGSLVRNVIIIVAVGITIVAGVVTASLIYGLTIPPTTTTSTTSTSSTTSSTSSTSTTTTSTTSTSTTSTTTTSTNAFAVALNQPAICPNATWSPNGITLANSTYVGTYPWALFIDTHNALYVAETSLNRVQMWPQGSSVPTRNLSGGLNAPHAVAVTANGNIYVDNGYSGSVYKWTSNSTSGVAVMSVSGRCMGLYVDQNNTLYCSMDGYQKVVAMSLNVAQYTPVTVAGTGTAGSGATQLNAPNGIVVDFYFNLYVADWGNNRVQKFPHGQTTATTVCGTGAAGTITLNGPVGVMVDSAGYLYIADCGSSRIIGQRSYGYVCVVGCTGVAGSAANQLNAPQSVGFDSYGNIYVADSNNNRIQKFLSNSSCAVSG